jgi:hypothetical protein
MYLFPNLSIPKAICLSMLSSVVTVGYIVHDNNTAKVVSIPTTPFLNQPQPQPHPQTEKYEEMDKQLIMSWWTQQ